MIELEIPYTSTGPASVKSFSPTPITRPSASVKLGPSFYFYHSLANKTIFTPINNCVILFANNIEGEEIMQQLKIMFLKSSSQFFPEVLDLCKRFNDFHIPEKKSDYYVLSVTDQEIKALSRTFNRVCNRLINWKSTKFFIDNDELDSLYFHRICDILNCYTDSATKPTSCCDEGNATWGCKYLTNIALHKPKYSYEETTYWYEFGHFGENMLWYIDKPRLLSALEKEADAKLLYLCSTFDKKRISNVVASLPDYIDIQQSDTFEIKYEDLPLGVSLEKKACGIQLKSSNEKYNGEDDDILSFRNSIISFNHNKSVPSTNQKNIPSITFNDIGGIESIVQKVREVIELPIICPSLFNHLGTEPHKGVLLYGPPGCGKTLIAKAIANEINAHFIAINGPEILNKYVGQSEANLRRVFQEAEAFAPSIIYFDEFDSISQQRDLENHSLKNGVVNQLLTLMDGIVCNNQVFIIASTNQPDLIDPALLRPGRFDYLLKIDKPTLEGCIKIFKIHTRSIPISSCFSGMQAS